MRTAVTPPCLMNSDRPSPAKHGVIVEDLSTIICMIWNFMFKHMHIIPQSQCVLYIQNGTGETRIQLHTVLLKIFFIFKILLIQKTTFVQTYQKKLVMIVQLIWWNPSYTITPPHSHTLLITSYTPHQPLNNYNITIFFDSDLCIHFFNWNTNINDNTVWCVF